MPLIPEDAVTLHFIRSSGPGGQNVNKVASAVQLRCDVGLLHLGEAARTRLRTLAGRRLTADGTLIIAAQRHRTQEQNKRDAYERLEELIRGALTAPKPRRPTRPTKASKIRGQVHKQTRGTLKRLRSKVSDDE